MTHIKTGIKYLDKITSDGLLTNTASLIRSDDPGKFLRRIVTNVVYRKTQVHLIGSEQQISLPWVPTDINPEFFSVVSAPYVGDVVSKLLDLKDDGLLIVDCENLGMTTKRYATQSVFWSYMIPDLYRKHVGSHIMFVNTPGTAANFHSMLTLDINGNQAYNAKNRLGMGQGVTFDWTR